jgi:hypothetical protein
VEPHRHSPYISSWLVYVFTLNSGSHSHRGIRTSFLKRPNLKFAGKFSVLSERIIWGGGVGRLLTVNIVSRDCDFKNGVRSSTFLSSGDSNFVKF